MHLTHLSLTNFRNFARLDASVPGGPVLLVGSNAQGKTSLLEAVYFLATFESFHAAHDRQLINFIAGREMLAVGRIVAEFERQAHGERPASQHRLEVRLIQEPSGATGGVRLRKEILLDGVKRKQSEALGAFNAVLFLPQMMQVVEGGPEERRRYLNLALSQALPRYAAALSEYARTLAQRNALLKALAERSSDAASSASELAHWDEQLALYGAQIIHGRIHAVQELEQLAARTHRELTQGEEVLRLAYQPSYDPLPQPAMQFMLPIKTPLDRTGLALEKIQHGYLAALGRARSDDLARGATSLGPHRDELRLVSNGIDLGDYGSRGQGRTAMLALKLAEVDWIRQKTGQQPVLLLDEVLAELDPARRSDLLARLGVTGQALLTTTDLDLFNPEFVRSAAVWKIQAGRLVK